MERPRQGFLRSVEGTRGIAALAVLVFHVGGFTRGPLNLVTSRFWLGVPLFFVISGFVLYRPYSAATINGGQQPSLRRYVRARILRIVPAYWLALTATVIFLHHQGALGGFSAVSNYLLVFLPAGKAALVPPAWTLCIELAFYAALPLIAAVATKAARGGATPQERAVRLALVVALAFPMASAYFQLVGTRLSAGGNYPTLLPGFIDEFAVGMLLAILVERQRAVSASVSRLMLAIAVLIAVVANVALHPGGSPYATSEGWLLQRSMAVAFALALSSVILRQERTMLGRMLSARPIVAAGTISYGIYLWHFFFIGRLVGTRLWWSTPTDLLLVAALTSGAAWVSWICLEQPLLRLKDRSNRAAPPIQAAADAV